MGVLNKAEIEKKMRELDYNDKLMITPLLTESQIGPASVDIRLGSSIVIPQKTYVDKQDVTDIKNAGQIEHHLYEHTRLKYNSKFILHPNQLIQYL